MSIEKLGFDEVTVEKIPYTMLRTDVLQKLKSPNALAVWTFLASLPPDWKVNKEHVRKHFGFGEKKIKSVLAILKRSNLIEYVQQMNGSVFGKVSINVCKGNRFISEQITPELSTESTIVDQDTAGSISVRAESRTSGKDGHTKEIKKQKEIINKKSFCASRGLQPSSKPKQEPKAKPPQQTRPYTYPAPRQKFAPKSPFAPIESQCNAFKPMVHKPSDGSIDVTHHLDVMWKKLGRLPSRLRGIPNSSHISQMGSHG